MASAGLRDELKCSICLNLYTDPVSLRCGHNFCCSCIVRVLDTQYESGGYSCPDCRAEYLERPDLEKNRKLGNIVEHFLSTQHDMEETKIFCTYCTKSPVPAVKSCLQCENSLCDDHLTAHNKTMDHLLTEPTNSFGNKKCSVHKKVLELYCLQDDACLCVFCCLVGEHRGHQVELLDEAFENKKKKLRKYMDELNPQKTEVQARVQNLLDHQRHIQKKASDKRKNISKLFMDIKEQVKMAEKKALSEISRQEEKIMSQVSYLIKKLEKKKGELSRNMRHLEEMCHVTDPIRLLQETDPITVLKKSDQVMVHSDNMAAVEEEAPVSDLHKITDDLHETADDLDEVLISLTLYRSMRDIVNNVTSKLRFSVPDILLDVDTAHRYLKLSEDLKTATRSEEEQDRPESPSRFLDDIQVLSRCSLSSGRHYWEVEWNQIGVCDIGVSYPSIKREGDESGIGYNDKSWSLFMDDPTCEALHNLDRLILNVRKTCPMLGVFLDYEAGHLSFYELCDPIRHLHTFTASFFEPLHVIFYVDDGASVTIRS